MQYITSNTEWTKRIDQKSYFWQKLFFLPQSAENIFTGSFTLQFVIYYNVLLLKNEITFEMPLGKSSSSVEIYSEYLEIFQNYRVNFNQAWRIAFCREGNVNFLSLFFILPNHLVNINQTLHIVFSGMKGISTFKYRIFFNLQTHWANKKHPNTAKCILSSKRFTFLQTYDNAFFQLEIIANWLKYFVIF